MKKLIIALLCVCPLLTSCMNFPPENLPDPADPAEELTVREGDGSGIGAGDYYANSRGRVRGFNSDDAP
ncbi:MAG: hypothetical protein IJV00_04280 [Clostridia bacterium]|nr:hypothetical protein [Clostridia bacterium]